MDKHASQAVTDRLDELFSPFERSDAPGYCVGVRLRGRPLYRKAFGMASLEHGLANTPRTRMRIGSTTKHFVALLALMLEEEGVLRLDDQVVRHLPELGAAGAGPSLRQLITHTSGLRCYIDLSFLARGMAMMEAAEALPTQARQTSRNFAPGERLIYANSGYMLLTKVLERVTGRTLAQLLEERIFAPMAMHDTVATSSDYTLLPNAATLHVRLANGGFRRGLFPQEEFTGDGNIVSTLDDMLDWLAHLRAPRRLAPAAVWEALLTPTVLNNGTAHRYCMGIQRTPHRGVDTIQHAGAVIGGSAQMQTVPAHELDIVIMSNGGPVSPTKLALRVIDAVLGDEVLGPPVALARVAEFPGLPGQSYRTPSGFVFGFADLEGKLGLSMFGHDPVPLRHEDGQLRLEFEDAAVGPLAIEIEGTQGLEPPAQLRFSECGNAEPARRLTAQAQEKAAALAAVLGRYAAPDLGAVARIEQAGADTLLRIDATGGGTTLRLEALADGVLLWKNVDPLVPFAGSLTRLGAGRLVLNSARTRGLTLTRLA